MLTRKGGRNANRFTTTFDERLRDADKRGMKFTNTAEVSMGADSNKTLFTSTSKTKLRPNVAME
jgi:hypothetical protein